MHSLRLRTGVFSVGRLYSTVGVHPTYCSEFTDPASGCGGDPERHLEQLLALATANERDVVAIGECGLGETGGIS